MGVRVLAILLWSAALLATPVRAAEPGRKPDGRPPPATAPSRAAKKGQDAARRADPPKPAKESTKQKPDPKEKARKDAQAKAKAAREKAEAKVKAQAQARERAKAEAEAKAKAEEAYRVAEGLFARKMYDEAIRTYDALAKAYPDSRRVPDARYKAAEAARLKGKLPDALQRFLAMREAFPASKWAAAARFREGQILYLTGKFKRAVEALRAYEQTQGKGKSFAVPAAYFLGRALEKSGEENLAVEVLSRKALLTDPSFGAAALWAQAEIDRRQQRTDVATRLYLELILSFKKHPLAPEAALRAGELLRAKGRYSEAIRAYDVLLKWFADHPLAPAARFGRATARLASDQIDPAVEDAQALLTGGKVSRPLRAGALFLLAVGRLAQGKYAEAERYFRRIEETFQDTSLVPAARIHRVWALALLGRHDELLAAAPALLADETLRPYTLEVRYLAGRAALYRGKNKTALQYLNGLEKTSGDLAVAASLVQAELQAKRGAYRLAAAAFDRVVTNQKRLKEIALARAAAAYLAAGDVEKAEARAASLVEGSPKSPYRMESYWNLALARAGRSNFEGMREALQQLLKQYPVTPHKADAQYWSAWAHARAGRAKEAAAGLAAFLKEHPKHARANAARVHLAAVRHGQQQDEAAAALIESLLDAGAADEAPARTLYWLAGHRADQGRNDAAESALRALLARKTKIERAVHAAALLRLGELKLSGGDAKAAAEAFAELIRRFPASSLLARAMYGNARAQVARKQYNQAETTLTNIRARGLLRARATFELGKVFQAQGKLAEASRTFLRVAILYEPSTSNGPVDLCAEALLRAAQCELKLGSDAQGADHVETGRERLRELLKNPWYRKSRFADEAQKLLDAKTP